MVIKELLDNACDATDKAGSGSVEISVEGNTCKISNTGVITFETLKKVADFSVLISEKYRKYSFQRGAIGHGLKLAIMLGISERSPFIVESDNKKYTIELINRQALLPDQVLNISRTEISGNDGKTNIFFTAKKPSAIQDFVIKYIAVNPHISFIFNDREYLKTIKVKENDLKKRSVVDIFSYNRQDFENFISAYESDAEGIIRMFNVPESRVKNILLELKYHNRQNANNLFDAIKANTKKITQPFIGRKAITERLRDCGMEVLDYDKLRFEHGSAEFVSLKGNINLVGINGSCISAHGLYLGNKNEIASLQYWWPPHQVKSGICMFYNTTKPYFKDVNKQNLEHNHSRLTSAIVRMKKRMAPQIMKDPKSGWLIMRATDEDLANISREASQYGFTSRIYLFLMKAKEMTKQLNKLYGPITLRQLYYKLVSEATIANNDRSYHNFIDHMTSAREKGVIESHLFEDRSRREIFHYGVSHKANPATTHIKESIMQSLEFPDIDIWDNQPYYVELWIEKDALISLFNKVAAKKQVHLFPSRGYTSHTKIYEAQQRFAQQRASGKQCVLLYFGDLDPSGMDIFRNIDNKFSSSDVKVERKALDADHVRDLIPIPVKDSDKRSDKFKTFMKENNLEGCYELDAMDAGELTDLASASIDFYYEKELYPAAEIEEWKQQFEAIKSEILKRLQ